MNKTMLITGTVLGILGICLGAFAAHGLEKLISEDAIKSFETGVRYQMYHAFFLVILGATKLVSYSWLKAIYIVILTGVIFFSGSIYGLSTNNLSSFDFKQIAFMTPIGGLLLIFGWIFLLVGIVKETRNLSN
ncbi:DUF423 domain-containing protein [Winogradskyella aurantiaca]|uniref:DUF423 domain-containing protein n=1 Tax=Winogradskyella aurantiaca TaxID=2219558 RepID=UPI0018E51076|nr:DUF423 domain-containing protein [Winogradskyella aurantiaca]